MMTDIEAAISYALTDDVLTEMREAAVDAGTSAVRARTRDVEAAQFAAARLVLVAAIVPVVERLIAQGTH